MALRRPRTAAQSTALPSLAALLASGVALDGCDSATEGANRMQRLTDHGQRAASALDNHRTGEAATQVGIGLGLLGEPPETRIQAPGEAPVVTTDPVPTPTGGVAAPVTPQVDPPPPSQTDVDGAIPRVDPTPPQPPPPQPPPHTAGAPMPVQVTPPPAPPPRTPHRTPETRVHPRGGATAVRPGGDDVL